MSSDATIPLQKMFTLGIIISLPSLLGGFAEGYATLALPQMKLNVDEASWFSSVSGFGSPVGAILLGILVDTIGRRNSILAGIASHIIGWSLLAWNYNISVVLTGRLLTGLTMGSLFYPAQVYAAECLTVHHDRLRSSLATWSGITSAFGVFLIMFLSYFFDYQIISTFAAIIAISLFVLIRLVIPESPTWLYLQNRAGDAELSEKRLGIGHPILTSPSLSTLTTENKSEQKFSWLSWIQNLRKICRKDVYKPILILTFATVILTFSGAHAVQVYQVDVVGANPNVTNPNISQHYSYAYKTSVVSGFLVFIGHTLITIVLPILGIRKTTITSCLCMAAGFILLGYASEAKESGDFYVLRSVAIWLIIFTYHFGVQLAPLTILSDSFPVDAKGFAGIPIIGLVVSSAVLSKVHPYLVIHLGANIYYIYAGISFLGAFYVIAFFYETVGKTLEEINEQFKK